MAVAIDKSGTCETEVAGPAIGAGVMPMWRSGVGKALPGNQQWPALAKLSRRSRKTGLGERRSPETISHRRQTGRPRDVAVETEKSPV
jgi:hypothetical protein